MSTRRWLPYAAIALAAHLTAVAAVRPPQREAARVEDETAVPEVDLETEAPEREAVAPSPEVARAEPQVLRAGLAALRGPSPGSVLQPEASPSPAVERGPSAPTDDGWSFNPARPSDLLDPGAIAHAGRAIGAEPGAATEPPGDGPARTTGVSATGGLAEGLDAHDAAVGMGRGGPVISALEAAAESSGAPDGEASFDVTVDSGGRVSVALLHASGATAAWSKVGAAAGASLDPRRVRVPPGARGWHVVASVEAKMQYPNGADPAKLGTHIEATATPELAENPHRSSVEDPPIVLKKEPGITVAHSGKVCSVKLHLGLGFSSPISGGCDPSNIGARPLRVVHGHIVSEGRL